MKVLGIGKWLLALVCIGIVQAHSPIGIEILDAQGRKADKVQLGLPFYIDVEVVTEEHSSHPKLVTDPAIVTNMQGSRSSVYSINGHRTVSKNYRYSAQALDEGSFSVGPATVMIGGVSVDSETKTITVQIGTASKEDIDQDTQAHLEIKVDRTTVYKGEEVAFILRLYMKNNDIHIEGIQEPAFTKCTASALEGPVSGEENINGITYKYLEWKTKFYAHEAGSLVIPAICANISMEVDRGHGVQGLDFLGMVGSILGSRLEHKQLFSNAIKLEVLDLPVSEKPVSALGLFTSLTAKTNLETASEGEGVVLTLELVGQGNFSMIQHPPLQLPEGLQYYDSNTSVHPLGAGVSKKDFEYIVQGTKSGNYVIPSQECIYFDKNKHTYKTLITKPIKLSITPSKVAISSASHEPEDEPTISENQAAVLTEIGSIEEGSWQDSVSKAVTLKTFLLAILLFFVMLIVMGIRLLFISFQEKNAPYHAYTVAFAVAKKRITDSKKQGSLQQLYAIWVELFALRLKLPANVITEQRIELALKNLGYSQDLISEWKLFFTQVMAASYSASTISAEVDLYELSCLWMDRLEGKL